MAFKTYSIGPEEWAFYRKIGMPFRSKISNLASASYADGQAIVGLSPGISQRLILEQTYVWSNADVDLDEYINGPLLAYTSIGPRINLNQYNRSRTIPINDVIYAGMTVGLVAVGAISNAKISFALSGVRTCNESNYNAKSWWMFVGDSNTNTTILNPVANDNFYHGHFANLARDNGADVFRIMKGEGGATSTQADYYRDTNLLTIDRCDLIGYMFGTNDSFGLSQFQQPFENFLIHRQRYYPKSKLIVFGPPYRGDGGGAGQETNLIAIRAYIVSRMPNIANAIYVDLSDVAASGVPHNTTYSPDGVHWIGAAHTLWGLQIYTATQAAGWKL